MKLLRASGGEKWGIKERLKWEFWISGAAKYFLENRKVVVKRFSGGGKAFNKAGIGSDCRSDPIRTGMFAFGAELRIILRNAVFNNPSSDNRILTYD